MAVEGEKHGSKSIRAQRFENTGEKPCSSAGVLVLLVNETWNNNPFAGFSKPAASTLQTVLGSADVPMEPLDKLNAIAARYEELGGPAGCTNDRICAVPPWVCCLPGICCLGGGCLVLTRGNTHITHMKREWNDVMAEPHDGYKWTLCTASHTSKVNMSNMDTHDDFSGGRDRTATTTITWIEVVPIAPHATMLETISSAPDVAVEMT